MPDNNQSVSRNNSGASSLASSLPITRHSSTSVSSEEEIVINQSLQSLFEKFKTNFILGEYNDAVLLFEKIKKDSGAANKYQNAISLFEEIKKDFIVADYQSAKLLAARINEALQLVKDCDLLKDYFKKNKIDSIANYQDAKELASMVHNGLQLVRDNDENSAGVDKSVSNALNRFDIFVNFEASSEKFKKEAHSLALSNAAKNNTGEQLELIKKILASVNNGGAQQRFMYLLCSTLAEKREKEFLELQPLLPALLDSPQALQLRKKELKEILSFFETYVDSLKKTRKQQHANQNKKIINAWISFLEENVLALLKNQAQFIATAEQAILELNLNSSAFGEADLIFSKMKDFLHSQDDASSLAVSQSSLGSSSDDIKFKKLDEIVDQRNKDLKEALSEKASQEALIEKQMLADIEQDVLECRTLIFAESGANSSSTGEFGAGLSKAEDLLEASRIVRVSQVLKEDQRVADYLEQDGAARPLHRGASQQAVIEIRETNPNAKLLVENFNKTPAYNDQLKEIERQDLQSLNSKKQELSRTIAEKQKQIKESSELASNKILATLSPEEQQRYNIHKKIQQFKRESLRKKAIFFREDQSLVNRAEEIERVAAEEQDKLLKAKQTAQAKKNETDISELTIENAYNNSLRELNNNKAKRLKDLFKQLPISEDEQTLLAVRKSELTHGQRLSSVGEQNILIAAREKKYAALIVSIEKERSDLLVLKPDSKSDIFKKTVFDLLKEQVLIAFPEENGISSKAASLLFWLNQLESKLENFLVKDFFEFRSQIQFELYQIARSIKLSELIDEAALWPPISRGGQREANVADTLQRARSAIDELSKIVLSSLPQQTREALSFEKCEEYINLLTDYDRKIEYGKKLILKYAAENKEKLASYLEKQGLVELYFPARESKRLGGAFGIAKANKLFADIKGVDKKSDIDSYHQLSQSSNDEFDDIPIFDISAWMNKPDINRAFFKPEENVAELSTVLEWYLEENEWLTHLLNKEEYKNDFRLLAYQSLLKEYRAELKQAINKITQDIDREINSNDKPSYDLLEKTIKLLQEAMGANGFFDVHEREKSKRSLIGISGLLPGYQVKAAALQIESFNKMTGWLTVSNAGKNKSVLNHEVLEDYLKQINCYGTLSQRNASLEIAAFLTQETIPVTEEEVDSFLNKIKILFLERGDLDENAGVREARHERAIIAAKDFMKKVATNVLLPIAISSQEEFSENPTSAAGQGSRLYAFVQQWASKSWGNSSSFKGFTKLQQKANEAKQVFHLLLENPSSRDIDDLSFFKTNSNGESAQFYIKDLTLKQLADYAWLAMTIDPLALINLRQVTLSFINKEGFELISDTKFNAVKYLAKAFRDCGDRSVSQALTYRTASLIFNSAKKQTAKNAIHQKQVVSLHEKSMEAINKDVESAQEIVRNIETRVSEISNDKKLVSTEEAINVLNLASKAVEVAQIAAQKANKKWFKKAEKVAAANISLEKAQEDLKVARSNLNLSYAQRELAKNKKILEGKQALLGEQEKNNQANESFSREMRVKLGQVGARLAFYQKLKEKFASNTEISSFLAELETATQYQLEALSQHQHIYVLPSSIQANIKRFVEKTEEQLFGFSGNTIEDEIKNINNTRAKLSELVEDLQKENYEGLNRSLSFSVSAKDSLLSLENRDIKEFPVIDGLTDVKTILTMILQLGNVLREPSGTSHIVFSEDLNNLLDTRVPQLQRLSSLSEEVKIKLQETKDLYWLCRFKDQLTGSINFDNFFEINRKIVSSLGKEMLGKFIENYEHAWTPQLDYAFTLTSSRELDSLVCLESFRKKYMHNLLKDLRNLSLNVEDSSYLQAKYELVDFLQAVSRNNAFIGEVSSASAFLMEDLIGDENYIWSSQIEDLIEALDDSTIKQSLLEKHTVLLVEHICQGKINFETISKADSFHEQTVFALRKLARLEDASNLEKIVSLLLSSDPVGHADALRKALLVGLSKEKINLSSAQLTELTQMVNVDQERRALQTQIKTAKMQLETAEYDSFFNHYQAIYQRSSLKHSPLNNQDNQDLLLEKALDQLLEEYISALTDRLLREPTKEAYSQQREGLLTVMNANKVFCQCADVAIYRLANYVDVSSATNKIMQVSFNHKAPELDLHEFSEGSLQALLAGLWSSEKIKLIDEIDKLVLSDDNPSTIGLLHVIKKFLETVSNYDVLLNAANAQEAYKNYKVAHQNYCDNWAEDLLKDNEKLTALLANQDFAGFTNCYNLALTTGRELRYLNVILGKYIFEQLNSVDDNSHHSLRALYVSLVDKKVFEKLSPALQFSLNGFTSIKDKLNKGKEKLVADALSDALNEDDTKIESSEAAVYEDFYSEILEQLLVQEENASPENSVKTTKNPTRIESWLEALLVRQDSQQVGKELWQRVLGEESIKELFSQLPILQDELVSAALKRVNQLDQDGAAIPAYEFLTSLENKAIISSEKQQELRKRLAEGNEALIEELQNNIAERLPKFLQSSQDLETINVSLLRLSLRSPASFIKHTEAVISAYLEKASAAMEGTQEKRPEKTDLPFSDLAVNLFVNNLKWLRQAAPQDLQQVRQVWEEKLPQLLEAFLIGDMEGSAFEWRLIWLQNFSQRLKNANISSQNGGVAFYKILNKNIRKCLENLVEKQIEDFNYKLDSLEKSLSKDDYKEFVETQERIQVLLNCSEKVYNNLPSGHDAVDHRHAETNKLSLFMAKFNLMSAKGLYKCFAQQNNLSRGDVFKQLQKIFDYYISAVNESAKHDRASDLELQSSVKEVGRFIVDAINQAGEAIEKSFKGQARNISSASEENQLLRASVLLRLIAGQNNPSGLVIDIVQKAQSWVSKLDEEINKLKEAHDALWTIRTAAYVEADQASQVFPSIAPYDLDYIGKLLSLVGSEIVVNAQLKIEEYKRNPNATSMKVLHEHLSKDAIGGLFIKIPKQILPTKQDSSDGLLHAESIKALNLLSQGFSGVFNYISSKAMIWMGSNAADGNTDQNVPAVPAYEAACIILLESIKDLELPKEFFDSNVEVKQAENIATNKLIASLQGLKSSQNNTDPSLSIAQTVMMEKIKGLFESYKAYGGKEAVNGFIKWSVDIAISLLKGDETQREHFKSNPENKNKTMIAAKVAINAKLAMVNLIRTDYERKSSLITGSEASQRRSEIMTQATANISELNKSVVRGWLSSDFSDKIGKMAKSLNDFSKELSMISREKKQMEDLSTRSAKAPRDSISQDNQDKDSLKTNNSGPSFKA